jgi:succinoglycan biosynthesis transport protein ExoP
VNDKAASAPVDRLSDLLRIVRRRWLLIVFLTAVVTAAAVAVSLRSAREYEATAKLLLGQSQGIDALVTGQPSTGSSDPERDINTHVELVTVDGVARAVKGELALPDDVDSLSRRAHASVEGNSNIIQLSVRDRNPRRAAAIANAFAEQYVLFEQRSVQVSIEQAATLVRRKYATLQPTERRSPEGRQLKARLRELEIASGLQTGGVSVVRSAPVPTSAVAPRPVLTGVIAGILGFLLSVGAALGLHFADRRLRDQDEVEALVDVPVLAAVPSARRRHARRPGDDARQYEAYTTLATNLRFFDVTRANEVVMLTSPGAQEGKTSVTLGLARALAMLGQRVVAIEADLRRPAFARSLGLHASTPREAPDEAHHPTMEWVDIDAETLRPVYGADEDSPTFAVVPGVPIGHPQALLSSQAMVDLIGAAREASDVVLIDVAPIGAVNDAITLSHLVDGTLLVARLNQTRRDAAIKSLELLRNVRAQLLGVVLTDASLAGGAYPSSPWGPRRSRQAGARPRATTRR